MQLYYSLNSPYARKARIIIHELDLEPRVKQTAVTLPADAKLRAINPLGKIPAMLLDDAVNGGIQAGGGSWQCDLGSADGRKGSSYPNTAPSAALHPFRAVSRASAGPEPSGQLAQRPMLEDAHRSG